MGRGHGSDPEVRHDGEVADRLPHAVALSWPRKQAGGADDAHRIRVRFHAGKSQPVSVPPPDQLPLLDLATDEYDEKQSEGGG
jgi:hypothetical protein